MHVDVQKVFNLIKRATAAIKSDRFSHVPAKPSNQCRLCSLLMQTIMLWFQGSKSPVWLCAVMTRAHLSPSAWMQRKRGPPCVLRWSHWCAPTQFTSVSQKDQKQNTAKHPGLHAAIPKSWPWLVFFNMSGEAGAGRLSGSRLGFAPCGMFPSSAPSMVQRHHTFLQVSPSTWDNPRLICQQHRNSILQQGASLRGA